MILCLGLRGGFGFGNGVGGAGEECAETLSSFLYGSGPVRVRRLLHTSHTAVISGSSFAQNEQKYGTLGGDGVRGRAGGGEAGGGEAYGEVGSIGELHVKQESNKRFLGSLHL